MNKIYPSSLNGTRTIEQAISHGKLLNKVFSVKETGINSKIFHSWKIAGLIYTSDELVHKWTQLSFIEYLWLQTLESMRNFGCSLKTMKELHNYLFTRAYKDNLGKKTLEENIAALNKISKQRPLDNEEFRLLYSLNDTLNNPILMSVPNRDITYFYQLVLKCFINNNEVGIIIYDNGKVNTYELEVGEAANSKDTINTSIPHILIPISFFIKKFIADEEKDKFLINIGILTESEMDVINQIRKNNVDKIIITLNNQTHTIKKIDGQISGIIKEEDAQKVKQVLGLKNYESIELSTRDQNTLSFTRTKKIK